MAPGLYVHVPFCQCVCSYCDFAKGPYKAALADDYLAALEAECRLHRASVNGPVSIETLYLGGGTPTSLSAGQLERLFDILDRYFDRSGTAESTCEANPGFVDAERFGLLRALGIDRLSMGLQSTGPETLKTLGRIHSGDAAARAVDAARDAGFRNMSLDLIFGVPGTDPADVEKDCLFVDALRVGEANAGVRAGADSHTGRRRQNRTHAV